MTNLLNSFTFIERITSDYDIAYLPYLTMLNVCKPLSEFLMFGKKTLHVGILALVYSDGWNSICIGKYN